MCLINELLPVREMLSSRADVLTNVTTANSFVLLKEVLRKFQSEELHCMYPKFPFKFQMKKRHFI